MTDKFFDLPLTTQTDILKAAANQLGISEVILEKDISHLMLALNPVTEVYAAPGYIAEYGVDAAAGWEFNPAFTAGIESSTRWEHDLGFDETNSFFGPTLSYSSGNWWATGGVGWKMTKDTEKLHVRLLMGINI